MKPKSFEIEAFTISYAAKKLGYKSTKTIYRLLKRDLLEDYVFLEEEAEAEDPTGSERDRGLARRIPARARDAPGQRAGSEQGRAVVAPGL